MRSETEMMELITQTAIEDECIRAVWMDGSRTNPNVPRDKYQDYDNVYYVKNIEPFYNNLDWVRYFNSVREDIL